MTVLLSDSFNRANGQLAGSQTDSYNGGSAFTWQGATQWQILNNQINVANYPGSYVNTYVDPGVSDCSISADIVAINAYLLFRYADTSNYFVFALTSGNLWQNKAGTWTSLGKANPLPTAGQRVTISLSGSSIVVSANGTTVISVTNTFNQTATKHGVHAEGNVSAAFDNFEIDGTATGQTTTYVGGGSITTSSSLTSASHVILADGKAISGNTSLTVSEIFSYVSSGSLQSQSQLLSYEDMLFLVSGTLQSASNLGSGDSYNGASGTWFSGSGSILSLASLTSSEIEKYSGSGFMTSFSSLMGVEKRITEEKGNILSASLLGVNPLNVVLGVSGDILTNVSLFSGDLLNGMRGAEQFEDNGFVLMHIGLLSRENVFHLYIPHFPVGEIYLLGIMKNTISLEGKQKNTISLNGVMK